MQKLARGDNHPAVIERADLWIGADRSDDNDQHEGQNRFHVACHPERYSAKDLHEKGTVTSGWRSLAGTLGMTGLA
jgi:hypothetical protein